MTAAARQNMIMQTFATMDKPLNRREVLMYTNYRPCQILDALRSLVDDGQLVCCHPELPVDHYDQEYRRP